jgi:adenylosuccinate synthase
VALTKLDVLDGFRAAAGVHGLPAGRRAADHLPAGMSAQARVEPVYETLEGWSGSTRRRTLLA